MTNLYSLDLGLEGTVFEHVAGYITLVLRRIG